MPDSGLLVTALVVFGGSMLFLRMIAKEKHRRERYLTLRLEDKLKEVEEQRKRAVIEVRAKGQPGGPVETVRPAP